MNYYNNNVCNYVLLSSSLLLYARPIVVLKKQNFREEKYEMKEEKYK